MESIFDRDFYPTPAAVIERMLMGVEIFDKFVLEPSAGSGNIVDALNAQGVREVYACEINDRLRKTLSGKCTIIGKDFSFGNSGSDKPYRCYRYESAVFGCGAAYSTRL